ncbi:MAG: DUF1786 domain-containing protein [Candidatus Bathyarchaeota archaeon]|nr:DUF1786 domain-containing protein [Candidatus Bathyarchaeota archaeon]
MDISPQKSFIDEIYTGHNRCEKYTMKILALDIGAGTEDVLLYDDKKENIENCVKMVLPTPSLIYATKVRKATVQRKNVLVKGSVIGGGAFSYALMRHIRAGLKVFITRQAAYTIRNDLDQVRDSGFEIIDKKEIPNFGGEMLEIEEVNIGQLKEFLAGFDEDLSDVDYVGIAVQDHGASPKGMSDRQFRIEKIAEVLQENPKPEALAFKEDNIPPYFLRMRSAAKDSRKHLPNAKVLLMDTAPAAIFGCLEDPIIKNIQVKLVINVGNGHTWATIIDKNRIVGTVEHHTRMLTPEKFDQLLIRFANGDLKNQEVFQDNGHGVFFLDKPCGFSQIEKIVATGPNRNILNKTRLETYFAAPYGDVMMTGPVGLIQAVKKIYN